MSDEYVEIEVTQSELDTLDEICDIYDGQNTQALQLGFVPELPELQVNTTDFLENTSYTTNSSNYPFPLEVEDISDTEFPNSPASLYKKGPHSCSTVEVEELFPTPVKESEEALSKQREKDKQLKELRAIRFGQNQLDKPIALDQELRKLAKAESKRLRQRRRRQRKRAQRALSLVNQPQKDNIKLTKKRLIWQATDVGCLKCTEQEIPQDTAIVVTPCPTDTQVKPLPLSSTRVAALAKLLRTEQAKPVLEAITKLL
jgi:hypothetical protein